MAVDDSAGFDFFAPLLPWQHSSWQAIQDSYHRGKLPHGILAQGMAGIGKRAFVYRLAAWLLCLQKPQSGACGTCASCLWLKAGTHPDLRILPTEHETITKIDEIRALTDFVIQKGGLRVVIFDHSDQMTTAAANALLKTLEEPAPNTVLLLISDYPNRLLPTIKSRVQSLTLQRFDGALALAYVQQHIHDKSTILSAKELMYIADCAPLYAVQMVQSVWFGYRKQWLQTWIALQSKKRSPLAASEYWQSVLSLADFVTLTHMMLVLLWRFVLQLPHGHTDLDEKLFVQVHSTPTQLTALQNLILDVQYSCMQNIQEKIAYDRILVAMADDINC